MYLHGMHKLREYSEHRNLSLLSKFTMIRVELSPMSTTCLYVYLGSSPLSCFLKCYHFQRMKITASYDQ